jgi:hypothetical protein
VCKAPVRLLQVHLHHPAVIRLPPLPEAATALAAIRLVAEDVRHHRQVAEVAVAVPEVVAAGKSNHQ